ncbi:MAG: TIGR02281 family clan AA aspartic protease [gamma proteobacterium endosymbiont of Lamellibrachia anaximandri]|nr:TIGR02281 family clan AA aspartic protease [gamma proteobacterium endosymbiont of Lamellibrachia anaximandri]MBL3532584.1 TIGR02281 family clan AA aspartic protease [gamma proteobacterium endosymbiont of Lamellibrachia anaximandri]MBL3600546.1 TIGR02281 family clan AA aspartic protease [gamma proteobacterium endosymbiont of Lamellibrachia anaximandri]
MIFAAWALLLGLLALFFSDQLERQANPNRDLASVSTESGPKEITLLRNRAGHYVAPGTINGTPVIFLLDTGATNVAVSASLAERLALKRGAQSISLTANGRVKTWLTRLDQVQLGSIIRQDVRATIMPGMGGDEVLLGMSFLKHLELVQKGKTLILRQGE